MLIGTPVHGAVKKNAVDSAIIFAEDCGVGLTITYTRSCLCKKGRSHGCYSDSTCAVDLIIIFWGTHGLVAIDIVVAEVDGFIIFIAHVWSKKCKCKQVHTGSIHLFPVKTANLYSNKTSI